MKLEQYKIDYYEEAIALAFEHEGIYDLWGNLPREKRESIASAIVTSMELQSMAFGNVETRGAESHEVTVLKRKLAEAEKDAEEWRKGFVNNVSMRRGWDKNEISVTKDGEAYIR